MAIFSPYKIGTFENVREFNKLKVDVFLVKSRNQMEESEARCGAKSNMTAIALHACVV